MGSQRPGQARLIKAHVRRRDGHRCVVCHLDARTHQKRYNKIPDVHRVVPGSRYSLESGVCVALCMVCHGARHGHGPWGWTATNDPDDDQQLAAWVRQSSYQDLSEEETWRKREAWGTWVRGLRSAKLAALMPEAKPAVPVRKRRCISPVAWFARLSGLPAKTLRDFEAGRREPLLSEARQLAAALGISIDELATEQKPSGEWQALCKEQSHRRALVLHARRPQVGEIEALSRAARLVWEDVGRADKKRAEEREAARQAEEWRRQDLLAKRAVSPGKIADPG